MTNAQTKRWYEEDKIVKRCFELLENLNDTDRHKTAAYLMEKIINKPPFAEMTAEKVFQLATSEERKRRWYDSDSIIRIFVELLRHASPECRREIAIMTVTFIEDLA